MDNNYIHFLTPPNPYFYQNHANPYNPQNNFPFQILPTTSVIPTQFTPLQFTAQNIVTESSTNVQTVAQNTPSLISKKQKRGEEDGASIQKKPKLMINSDASQAVEEYKKLGKITLTLDNVFSILLEEESLKSHCYAFIQKSLHPELLPLALEFSVKNQIPELTWICFLYGQGQGKDLLNHKALNESKIENIQVKLLVNALIGLIKCPLITLEKELGEVTFDLSHINREFITPEDRSWLIYLDPLSKLMPITLRALDETELYDWNISDKVWTALLDCAHMVTNFIASHWDIHAGDLEKLKSFPNIKSFGSLFEFLDSLEALNEYLELLKPITPCSLNLSAIPDADLTDEALAVIASQVPELKELIICSEEISHIPFKQLTRLEIKDCHVKELTLPFVNEIYSDGGLQALTKVDVPQAKILRFYDNDEERPNQITEFNAPEATCVCFDGKHLEKLFLPKAETVKAKGKELKEILAPLANVVSLRDCFKLETLITPQVDQIKLIGISSLKKLELKEARLVLIEDCDSITNIDAPEAEIIICKNLKSLENVNLPKAKIIIFEKCPSLKELVENGAQDVICLDCEGLQALMVSNASKVLYEGCYNLKNVMIQHESIVRPFLLNQKFSSFFNLKDPFWKRIYTGLISQNDSLESLSVKKLINLTWNYRND